ncbi:MAG: carboxypeptidase C (cathepsin A) [Planctomycetota bacterium]|jgi:carboxypeptidase C (cathepsin A)
MHHALLTAVFSLISLPVGSFFQEESVAPQATDAAVDDQVVTRHTLNLAGEVVPYEARTGTMMLTREGEEDVASIFFVAYERVGEQSDGERPVTFVFNGGPGSSSVWLHLGAFGPKRVEMSEEGFATAPPYRLVDNEASILDRTDLVFIDPPTTGYSRPAEGIEGGEVHGVEQDAQWVAEFIRLWVTRFERWDSPKFLAGESYGTTRSAALAQELQDKHGMYLNGILLISSILNFQTARFDVGNDLPYVLFLPTYAATAWYHGRLSEELQADFYGTLKQAEQFALGPYASALLKGDRLEGGERAAIVTELARLTGLSEEYVEAADLRPVIHSFCKELCRDKHVTVGRLDSRFSGKDRLATGVRAEFDPSLAAINGPYTATLNRYVREELGYHSDLPYEILTGRVQPWDWGVENSYLNVAERLRSAMTKNPALKVYVANGYYDLATPYFATTYTFDHMQLDPALKDNVRMGFFQAGHMMYIHQPSRVGLKEQLDSFYDWALAAPGTPVLIPGSTER